MKKINKISQLINKRYDEYIQKYSLKSLQSIGSENYEIKRLRYSVILDEIIFYKKNKKRYKILDVGCGLGDFYDFLLTNNFTKNFEYTGTEINKNFLEECQNKYDSKKFYLSDILKISPREKYDWIIFSGTFYHMPKNVSSKLYFEHIKKILLKSWKFIDAGLIINFINNKVEYKIDKLFYPNHLKLIDFFNTLTRFQKQVSNYPMFETTYVLYKDDFVKSKFYKKQFQRYLKKK